MLNLNLKIAEKGTSPASHDNTSLVRIIHRLSKEGHEWTQPLDVNGYPFKIESEKETAPAPVKTPPAPDETFQEVHKLTEPPLGAKEEPLIEEEKVPPTPSMSSTKR